MNSLIKTTKFREKNRCSNKKQRKFCCSQCEAEFTTKRALKVHSRGQHSNNTHVCEDRGQEFNYESYKRHRKNFNINLGSFPFSMFFSLFLHEHCFCCFFCIFYQIGNCFCYFFLPIMFYFYVFNICYTLKKEHLK